jgi:hypothetical protein
MQLPKNIPLFVVGTLFLVPFFSFPTLARSWTPASPPSCRGGGFCSCKTFLGALVSNIVLDTTSQATDTIDYVASDSTGLTATSTRTILIKPIAPPPATSPSATSTAN